MNTMNELSGERKNNKKNAAEDHTEKSYVIFIYTTAAIFLYVYSYKK